MGQNELMQEIEALRVTEQACRKQFAERFELRVSSTEIIDALFEECQVELQDRLPLLRLFHCCMNEVNKCNTKEFREEFEVFRKRFNSVKFFELIKIRGTVESIEKQIKAKTHILCRKRFLAAIEYFLRLRDGLALFGITEKDENSKLDTNRKREVQVHRQFSETKRESVLVFDFGLVLKHQTSFHSGLFFSAVTPYQAS